MSKDVMEQVKGMPLGKAIMCVTAACMKETNETASAYTQSDVIPFALKHDLMAVIRSDTPDVVLAEVFHKKEFRADLAKLLRGYTQQVLKPQTESAAIKKDIECVRDSKCAIDDLERFFNFMSAVLEVMNDKEVNKASMEVWKMVGKRSELFVKEIHKLKKD